MMRSFSRLKAWWTKFYRAWLSIHLTSYGGKYSIERMLALDEYIRITPLWRVLLVIFATPVPMALLVIAQESVPLQDPAEGWQANYGFWIRVVVLQGTLAFSSVVQAASTIKGATLSTRQLVVFFISFSVLSTVAHMGVAACWTFPIPFFTISLSMLVLTIMVFVFRAVVGGRAFREMVSHKEQLMEFNNFNLANLLILTTYPAFQVLFQASIDTKWEQPTILLLPVIKLVMKYIYMRLFSTKEDMLPQQATFSVILFDALYLATCMQSLRSFKTVLLIMTVDVIEAVIELRELHCRTRKILTRLQNLTGFTSTDLLSAVRYLCHRFQNISQERTTSDIRLRSCINSHRISHNSSVLLQQLDGQPMPVSPVQRHSVEVVAPKTTAKWWRRAFQGNEVQPMTPVIPVGPIWKPSTLECARQPVDDSVSTLREVLEALFTAECLVLAEYLETFIPILYANYILVMARLPSAKYHQEMQGVTADNAGGTVESVFLYGLLELVSFVALAVIVRRNCGIQALYHLGFVLETQTALVQSTMLIWAMVILAFRVVHFGADFSFQFAWIGNADQH